MMSRIAQRCGSTVVLVSNKSNYSVPRSRNPKYTSTIQILCAGSPLNFVLDNKKLYIECYCRYGVEYSDRLLQDLPLPCLSSRLHASALGPEYGIFKSIQRRATVQIVRLGV
jgi:hypothetical protein